MPAAITPFDARGRVDEAALARLLQHFESQGCAGVVVAGTTGEGPSLSADEKRDLVRMAVRLASLPVVLGVASNSQREAIWLLQEAHEAGAIAGLLMAPHFFRETDQASLTAWFREVLDGSPLPVLNYNFPQRTGLTLSAELMAQLSSHPRCAGLKDSSGNRDNLVAYRQAMPKGKLYVGDERLLLEALACGWNGSISGAANSIARRLVEIHRAFGEDAGSAAAKMAEIALTLEKVKATAQPQGHKAVLKAQGVIPNAGVRLPLSDHVPTEEQVAAVAALEA